MAHLLKGEVRWVDIEPVAQVTGHEQGNPRPALILSGNSYNQNSGLVIAAMITPHPGEGQDCTRLKSRASACRDSHGFSQDRSGPCPQKESETSLVESAKRR